MELNNVEGLLDEIKYLKNKAKLLNRILYYYDRETMSINIPAKWKNARIMGTGHRTPKSPRHALNKDIRELLPEDEHYDYVNRDLVDELL